MGLAAATVLMVGCGNKPADARRPADTPPPKAVKAGSSQGVQVAVVEGADMLFTLDMAAMRETPIMQAIKARREADGKTAPGKMGEDEWVRIQEVTGLTEKDFLTVLLSADLDTIDLDNPKPSQEINGAMGSCAIALAKSLPFPKLYECMGILSSRSKGAKLEEIEIAGRPVARVLPTSPKEPVVHTAVSRGGNTLLIAFNAAAMEGMLARDNANEAGTPDPKLTELGTKVENGTQVRLLVLASDGMRKRIQAKIDSFKDPNPQEHQTKAGMMVTFFSPIRNIKNFVMGAKAGEALDVILSGDLANASEAQQCAHLLQSFIVPMIGKSIESIDPENKLQVDDSLMADNKEATLLFTLKVTAQDVIHWQQPGS